MACCWNMWVAVVLLNSLKKSFTTNPCALSQRLIQRNDMMKISSTADHSLATSTPGDFLKDWWLVCCYFFLCPRKLMAGFPEILATNRKGKTSIYGCFLKCWYPQITHFNRVFHYFHHPFWGTTILGNPPYGHMYKPTGFWVSISGGFFFASISWRHKTKTVTLKMTPLAWGVFGYLWKPFYTQFGPWEFPKIMVPKMDGENNGNPY